MSCYIRSGNDLGKGSPEERKNRARTDLIMEFASLLMVAQERHREGKKERRGEGEWYTTKPRFGQKVEDQKTSIYTAVAERAASVMMGKKTTDPPISLSPPAGIEKSTENAAVLAWRDLKPGLKTWDPKMDYKAIGKDKESDWDEVSFI